MPVRRWAILVALLSLSLVGTVLPLVYVLLINPALYERAFTTRPSRAIPFMQFLEPLVDYGLLRLRGWGWDVGVPWFACKGVYAAGLSVGRALGGQSLALPLGLSLALLWLGIALFLYLNRIYFDR